MTEVQTLYQKFLEGNLKAADCVELFRIVEQQQDRIERYEMMYENTGAIFNRSHMKDRIEEQQKEIERLEKRIELLERKGY